MVLLGSLDMMVQIIIRVNISLLLCYGLWAPKHSMVKVEIIALVLLTNVPAPILGSVIGANSQYQRVP